MNSCRILQNKVSSSFQLHHASRAFEDDPWLEDAAAENRFSVGVYQFDKRVRAEHCSHYIKYHACFRFLLFR